MQRTWASLRRAFLASRPSSEECVREACVLQPRTPRLKTPAGHHYDTHLLPKGGCQGMRRRGPGRRRERPLQRFLRELACSVHVLWKTSQRRPAMASLLQNSQAATHVRESYAALIQLHFRHSRGFRRSFWLGRGRCCAPCDVTADRKPTAEEAPSWHWNGAGALKELRGAGRPDAAGMRGRARWW